MDEGFSYAFYSGFCRFAAFLVLFAAHREHAAIESIAAKKFPSTFFSDFEQNRENSVLISYKKHSVIVRCAPSINSSDAL